MAALAAFRSAEGLPLSPGSRSRRRKRGANGFSLESADDGSDFGFDVDDHLDSDDDQDAYDDDNDPEPTWDEILASDLQFSAVAAVVESLVKRGNEAIAWQVDRKLIEGAGRVLTADEIEQRTIQAAQDQDEDEDGDDYGSAADDDDDDDVTATTSSSNRLAEPLGLQIRF